MSLRRFIREPEIIGPPDCPIINRWTLFDGGEQGVKLLLHHFPPNADDRDVHDHPRPFWTLILRGGYDDLIPCPSPHEPWPKSACALCIYREGLAVGDRMRPGMLRFRPARHAHRTRALPSGCWTLVLMGPIRRPWGFWRSGRWWFWKDYEREFGFAMRCEDLDLEYRR